MSAAPSDFFKTARTASEIKAELLPQMFEVWASTRLQQGAVLDAPLAFLDAQAGLDSGESAPTALQLLRLVYKSSGSRTDLNKGISTLFYDAEPDALAKLQREVEQAPFYQDLLHLPIFLSEADDETLATQLLESAQPDLAFLDPGMEGIAQQLLLSAAKGGKTDLLMLFNPKLVEHAVRKAKADSLWQRFFGERLEQIKAFYKAHKRASRKEEYLLDCLEEVLQRDGRYTLRFRINSPDKKETSHYWVFSVKSGQVYLRLKELLERYSDYQEDGVPLFGANLQAQQTSLFHEHLRFSVEKLTQELLTAKEQYSNKPLKQIYEQHSFNTHYTLENYSAAFERLMRQGKVRFVNPKTGQPVSKMTPISLIRYTQ